MGDDIVILRCSECGVSWMHGDAPKHVMTCNERYRGMEITEESLDDAISEIRSMVDAAASKRDAKLQSDCDAVDSIERQHSRFMFALKDMGFVWVTGDASSISEFGVRYVVWCNGDYKPECEPSRLRSSLSEVVDDAILEFKRLYASGERFIVWRQNPEFGYFRDHVKSWVRFHTLREVPVESMRRVRDGVVI